MADESPELDDFGLPIRKFAPRTAEFLGADSDCPARPQPSTGSRPHDPAEKAYGTIAPTEPAAVTGKFEESRTSKDPEEDDCKNAKSSLRSVVALRTLPEQEGNMKTPEPVDGSIGVPVTESFEKGNSTEAEVDDGVKVEKDAETTKMQDQAISSAKQTMDHERNTSTASDTQGFGVGNAISEFSHQQLSVKKAARDEEDDGEWQEMPAFAPYDMYDNNDQLIAREHHESEDETYGYAGLGGAGKGYTRVVLDEDVQSATSLDEDTQYLFNSRSVGTSAQEDEDTQKNAVSQLQATKDLLTEGQRVAYVGLTRLVLSTMTMEAEAMPYSKPIKKEVRMAAENMKMWSQKMMFRLYTHMDISPDEQIMIEQLAAHGVAPKDLTPLLLANARVKNPMAAPQERRSSVASPRRSEADDTGQASVASAHSSEEEVAADLPPAYEANENAEVAESVRMPSQMPTTQRIDIDLRWTVLCDLFLVLVADSIYDARSRTLLERVARELDIPWIDICKFEKKVTDALEMQQNAEKENWNEEEHMESRRKLALRRRYVMMGLATVGGGLVIGLSAGLLAPVIGAGLAAGFTTIGVTGTSSFLAGAGGAAIITSSAAASGSIVGGRAADRRTGAVKTFEYRPLHNNKRVNLIVTVSGWMTGKVDDVRLPFSTIDSVMGDIYSILWEPEMLRSMGDTINILATEALTSGLQQVLGATILTTLMGALQLPVILTKLSYLIDNPWATSLDRASMAGLILADSLVDRNLGTRPITLVGYSLGSRVIFCCLQELARKGAYGLVQNVYLFGSPVVVNQDQYLRARTVVSGRFVNGYNRNDWILGYLFRLTNGGIKRVAGLAPIEDVPGLENMDCTEAVPGHMQYRSAMPRLMRECGWLVESDEFTEIEDPDPDNHTQRQRELINEIEEARKELEKGGKTKKGAFGFFKKKKAKERKEWEVYEAQTGRKGMSENKNGNSHAVLFDVDAIRAEVAKEAHDKDATSEGVLQTKEIKATLPPIELDAGWPPSPDFKHQESLRGSKSIGILPCHSPRDANGFGGSAGLSSPPYWHPPSSRSTSFPAVYSGNRYHGQHDGEGEATFDDGIQMTFDTSSDHHSAAPQTKFDTSSYQCPAPEVGDSKPEHSNMGVTSAKMIPNISLADPWADDDEFREKEISMTFA